MSRTLLLDRNYMALSLVHWKRAVKLMVKGKVEPVQGSGTIADISCVDYRFMVPSIIRLKEITPWKAHSGKIKFSRKNILLRDQKRCQYCGIKVGKNASIDHVIPKSRGGETNYYNCVACCKKCNGVKADRTPDEAGMELLDEPKRPTFISLFRMYLNKHPEEWKDYIIGL